MLKTVQLKPDATAVMAHCYGGYTTNMLMTDFDRPDNLLAYKHDGNLLHPSHGGPVRLMVPHLYFWKSAKWLKGLEFISKDRPGFWEQFQALPSTKVKCDIHCVTSWSRFDN